MNSRKLNIVVILVLALSFGLLGCDKNSTSQIVGKTNVISQEQTLQVNEKPNVVLPIQDALKRVTKKPFGIKVSPGNSPVSPERFTGYHTGVDFETFDNEHDKDVAISAICEGKILLKRKVSGYGGVLVEACQFDNQAVTVLYGHLKLTSIKQNLGETLKAGESFAVLGAAYSLETDGERKHLHLGIKKGSQIDLRGYVQNESELGGWLDFEKYLQQLS